jgi:hypothetical protein
MKTSKTLLILSILVALCTFIQAGAGLFWPVEGSPFSFNNLRGQAIQMSGRGMYQNDPLFDAPIQRGTDAVMLFFYIPLLVVALILYRRGSLGGQLLLIGILAIFLYRAASVAFGVSYNQLFLVYLAQFSTSLFAFVLAVATFDLRIIAARITPAAPRTGFAILLFITSIGLLFAWLPEILIGLPQGWNAGLRSYTTMVTDLLDLGIIVPALILTSVLLLRRAPMGYLLASVLTIMLVLIAIVLTAQTIFQLSAGIQLGMGEFIGKGGSFMLLGLIGIWLLARFFRSLSKISVPTAAIGESDQA